MYKLPLSRIQPLVMVAVLLLVPTVSDAAGVDNPEPGGSTSLATSAVDKLAAIGSTLGLGSSTTTANRRPSISGTPPATVVVGKSYLFRPRASDPDGQQLSFAISRKPSWAKFDARTGRLYGRPTAANIGTYKNIRIAVSDGQASSYVGPFRIEVKKATTTNTGTGAPTLGSVTLRWVAPTQNEDGSALTNLAGYRINYGTSRTALSNSINVANPGATSRTISGLTPATWYFSMTAYTNAGVESGPSVTASKTIQ